MLKTVRNYLFLLVVIAALAWVSSSAVQKRSLSVWASDSPKKYGLTDAAYEKMKSKAVEAKTFVQQKGYNSTICFMIDMSLPSSQNRFFVYNIAKDSIYNAGLVTHGRCNQYWLEGRKYGNTVGCGCTSLGKYKIGNSYQGKFGLAYKLYGLDKTNNKAYERFVVLHSHECVPETEVKDEICQSDGCPTVSPNYLQYLKPIIDESKKPVLLWIYQ
jgi:hypothetical protein